MGQLRQKIASYSPVALDTVIFIYHFEKNECYLELTNQIFSRLDEDEDFRAKPLGELLRVVGQLSDQEQLELIAQLSRRLANKVGFPFATPNLDGNVGFRS